MPPSLQGGPCQSTDFFVYTKIQIQIKNIYIYICTRTVKACHPEGAE